MIIIIMEVIGSEDKNRGRGLRGVGLYEVTLRDVL